AAARLRPERCAAAIQTVTLQWQDVLFHHGDTEGTEVSQRDQAQHDILVYSLLSGAGIILLLQSVFRKIRHTLLTLANLPFALVDGIVAAFLSGGVLSVGSLVVFVTLIGIRMRNSLMMICDSEQLVGQEG